MRTSLTKLLRPVAAGLLGGSLILSTGALVGATATGGVVAPPAISPDPSPAPYAGCDAPTMGPSSFVYCLGRFGSTGVPPAPFLGCATVDAATDPAVAQFCRQQ